MARMQSQAGGSDKTSIPPKKDNHPHKNAGPPWWRSCRYLLAVMHLCGMATVLFQRTHLSLALVCMVNHTALEDVDLNDTGFPVVGDSHAVTANSSSGNESIFGRDASNLEATPSCSDVVLARKEDGPYVWSRDVQGLLLGAMFWSYMALQIPGAVLADRYLTVKVTTIVSVAAMSVVHLVTPLLADFSPWTVMAARLLVGVFVGLFHIASYNVWTRWAPPSERSRLVSISSGGIQLANILVFPVSALLCSSPWGWPSIFYVFSAMGLVWCLLSLVLVYESPDVHPRISVEEREYIVSAISNSTSKQKKDAIPWKKILTSAPLHAVSIGIFSSNWANFQMTTTLPMFMREVLKFDINHTWDVYFQNGVFSMLPMLAAWIGVYFTGFVSDLLIRRRVLSVTYTRKVIQSVGQISSALLLVGLSFLDCDHQMAAVALLTLSMGALSVNIVTLPVNVYDVAPKYFSVCYAISNTVGVLPGFLAPMVVAAVTKERTREQWQTTFFISAAIMVTGSLVFIVLGRGEPLPWATGENTTITIEMDLEVEVKKPSEKLEDSDKDAEPKGETTGNAEEEVTSGSECPAGSEHDAAA